ncbi:MAG: hypothetical protein KDI46_02255 [Alphaproteobacteria bacterium]|nr:hypothetical protein [Alphaproteobacteria bacterium]
MNIDLLFTPTGEAGLLSNVNLVKKVAGILFDPQSGLVSLEYIDMDYEELNIPVDEAFFERLDRVSQVHIGAVKDGQIAQAYQVPFMFADDPYRGEQLKQVSQPANPLEAFRYFIQACETGQPLHREDLGDEEAMGCILGDAVPSSLHFAPHLARRHAVEAAPQATPVPHAPGIGLGLGGGGGSTYVRRSGQPPSGSGGQKDTSGRKDD